MFIFKMRHKNERKTVLRDSAPGGKKCLYFLPWSFKLFQIYKPTNQVLQ